MNCRDCLHHVIGPITGFEYCSRPKSAAADPSFVPLEFVHGERMQGGRCGPEAKHHEPKTTKEAA